jgi:ribosomal-protein-serine acetyltransferase
MADDHSGHDQQRGRLEATRRIPAPRTTIATDIPNLRLVALTPEDADAYYYLVDRNRGHLTQHGDWTELGEATPESVAASLHTPDDRPTQFGIWLDGQLIGRADLNPRTPGNFVLGYWLGGQFTGKGYATAACGALIAYGKAKLGATTIYAGVTKGNTKSEAVLRRLGFRAVADRGTYTRFTLPLT